MTIPQNSKFICFKKFKIKKLKFKRLFLQLGAVNCTVLLRVINFTVDCGDGYIFNF